MTPVYGAALSMNLHQESTLKGKPSLAYYERSMKRDAQKLGLRDMDAYHLACAVESGAEYFISVDDEILRKGREIESQYQIKVCNPTEFLRREDNGD